eukprot:TRINITY_DN4421_c1_g1_i1.p1 TRINITY_DN4421_c1_g1~~TRINITY_DN4421_c1_g1_i1.p1  ORF type:complete len:370 (+),score=57.05 TRINITY_DN4421_c1_g1_i1:145-1254(+)
MLRTHLLHQQQHLRCSYFPNISPSLIAGSSNIASSHFSRVSFPLLERVNRNSNSNIFWRDNSNHSNSSWLFKPQGSLGKANESAGKTPVENFLKFFGGPTISEPRVGLLLALGEASARQSIRLLEDFGKEAVNYLPVPDIARGIATEISPMGSSSSIFDSFMTVPNLETIPYKVVTKFKGFEVRRRDSFLVAETEMGLNSTGFDWTGSSNAFEVLAGFIFGKNQKSTKMEMTTPVLTVPSSSSRSSSGGSEKMEMTTPVMTQKQDDGQWKMAFVMPSKYDESTLPVPIESKVNIRRVPPKMVAVVAFPGIITEGIVKFREQSLREAIAAEKGVRIIPGAEAEAAQYNPPFTLPFMRRNEIAIEVELVEE